MITLKQLLAAFLAFAVGYAWGNMFAALDALINTGRC